MRTGGAIRIGTAGWAIPRRHVERFPGAGTGLARYAARLNAAEINTTFYRSHRAATYERWRDGVPEDFRFAVKMPKAITHERRLVAADDLLDAFLKEIAGLGEKRGPLLVQLPPKLDFDAAVAAAFFSAVRAQIDAFVACEPRHASWFTDEADAVLAEYRVARVAADPARVPDAARPGGWPGLLYIRLHGSPRTYFTPYEAERLDAWATMLVESSAPERWCIFDNTGSGAAAGDALTLRERIAAAE